MSGQEISVAGDADCIEKMCANVTELDLMENDITSWEEVVFIFYIYMYVYLAFYFFKFYFEKVLFMSI